MKKKYHWLLVAFLFVCVIGCFFYKSHHSRTLYIGVFAGSNWHVPESNSYALIDEAIRDFRQKNPGVDVKYVSGIKKEDYSEWLAEKFICGDEPDVFFILSDDFDNYAAIKALEPLDSYMDEDKDFDRGKYYKASIEYGRYSDKQYALPIESVPTLMFVNKTLLARENIEMPQDDWKWTDFFDVCQKVTHDTNGDGLIDQYGVYDYSWQHAAVTNGVKLFKGDGRTSYFADKRLEEAVRFIMKLHTLCQGQEPTAKDFDMGKVAFRPVTFAEYRTYQPYPWRIKKYTDFEWDLVKLPAGPAGENVSPVDTLLVGMGVRSREKKLAWEFLKQLCYDEKIQTQIMSMSQGLPVRRDVVESAQVQQMVLQEFGKINLAIVSEVMDTAVMSPKFKNYNEVMLKADREMQKIISGTIPFNNALNKLQKEINAYLQQ